ncbi:hypothetical protein K431DRAFT_285996 [Polychaeton citri CBS 116435]|uniref:Uncharacterized protein n=1 Tax=Polychaeton citri CBS 116435 TaxID=1314669 RepID=A0A9P4Q5Z7_9PEZI|nr:hypothetical protein K431DRAFT_285996 [Polychaeton citri CBS 116435]
MNEPISATPRILPPAAATSLPALGWSKNVHLPLRRVSVVSTTSSTVSTTHYDSIDKISLSRRSSRNAPARYRVARSSSIRSADVPLRHPTPDLQSLQGAYKGNVTRLEQSAEAMSQGSTGGSDGAEDVSHGLGRNAATAASAANVAEVRRSGSHGRDGDNVAHARALSRENSIQSSHHGEISVVGRGIPINNADTRSRASSYANSIVDVNGPARWGGYSPGGYVNSPMGSPRSGSLQYTSTMNRIPTSTSRSSRLAQMVEPTLEGRPLDSPLAPNMSVTSHSLNDDAPSLAEHSRQASQNSFGETYDQMATQITEHFEGVPPTPPHHLTSFGDLHPHIEEDHTATPVPMKPGQPYRVMEETLHAHDDFGAAMDEAFASSSSHLSQTIPERPRSADTFQQAQTAFHDFDGVHFDPEAEEFVEIDNEGNEVRRVSARTSSGTLAVDPVLSMLRQPARPMSMGAPPPEDGMVYYPAPVPRMLNLPKRLSQVPAQHIQAKRRTQILGQLGPEAMASAPWLSQTNLSTHSGGSGSGSGRPASGLSGSYVRPESKASGSYLHLETEARDFSGDREASPRPASHQSGHLDQSIRPSSNQYSNRSGSPAFPLDAYNQQPLSALRGTPRNRASIANMQNLPPQLRASAFFDHQSISQDIEVQGQSAVKTLDSILLASATAPVNAFTDHPYTGPQKKEIFGREKKQRNKSSTNLDLSAAVPTPESPEIKKGKRRSRSLMGMFRRNSSADKLQEVSKRNNSRGSVVLDLNEGGKKLQKRKSQMSLSAADELEIARSRMGTPGPDTPAAGTPMLERTQSELFREGGLVEAAQNVGKPDEQPDKAKSRKVSDRMKRVFSDSDQIEADFHEEEAQEDVSDDEVMFAAPTTLLAELQVRKAQQKGRNRTAATAFPEGMHSTLLELDAVEEVSKRKRQQAKIRLAWEDPAMVQGDAAENVEDDDVPLGMLYPNKDGVVTKRVGDDRDWNRPLGLMEKRALEDSEPLSSRRNRLRGVSPSKPATSGLGFMPNTSQSHLGRQPDNVPDIRTTDGGDDASDKEYTGETLADRRKRMQVKSTLDGALSDIAHSKDGNSRPVSTFTDDVLSQFGGLEVKDGGNHSRSAMSAEINAAANPLATNVVAPSPAADEEGETLAQRRARLTREREASGGSSGARPALRGSSSLANLLASNPIGQRQNSHEIKAVEGTLLHTSTKAQDQKRVQLMQQNSRFGGISQPLVDARPHTSRADFAGSTGLLNSGGNAFAATGGFQGGKFNTGMGSAGHAGGLDSSASTPMFGAGPSASNPGGYFSPHGGFQGGMWNNGMGGYQPSAGAAAYQPMGIMGQQPQQHVSHGAYAALTSGNAGHQSMMMLNNKANLPMATGMGGMQQMPSTMNMAGPVGAGVYGSFGGMASMAGQNLRPVGYGGGTGGLVEDPPMDARQRAVIDRWRLSVAQ